MGKGPWKKLEMWFRPGNKLADMVVHLHVLSMACHISDRILLILLILPCGNPFGTKSKVTFLWTSSHGFTEVLPEPSNYPTGVLGATEGMDGTKILKQWERIGSNTCLPRSHPSASMPNMIEGNCSIKIWMILSFVVFPNLLWDLSQRESQKWLKWLFWQMQAISNVWNPSLWISLRLMLPFKMWILLESMERHPLGTIWDTCASLLGSNGMRLKLGVNALWERLLLP